MRFAPPPLLVCLIALPLVASAKDPSQVDPAKKNESYAPGPANADTPVSPDRPENQKPVERNERVQDERVRLPEKIERKEAPVAGREAPINVTETREKNIIDRKDFSTPEKKEYDKYRGDGERYRYQPEGDMVKNYDKVGKYQERMTSATEAASTTKPMLEKQSSFEKINKFLFKRNNPGGDEGKPLVTTAGGPAPASQDTHSKYNIDWSGTAAAPRN